MQKPRCLIGTFFKISMCASAGKTNVCKCEVQVVTNAANEQGSTAIAALVKTYYRLQVGEVVHAGTPEAAAQAQQLDTLYHASQMARLSDDGTR